MSSAHVLLQSQMCPSKTSGIRVGAGAPSGLVEVEGESKLLLLPLCREGTGWKEVAEGCCSASCR